MTEKSRLTSGDLCFIAGGATSDVAVGIIRARREVKAEAAAAAAAKKVASEAKATEAAASRIQLGSDVADLLRAGEATIEAGGGRKGPGRSLKRPEIEAFVVFRGREVPAKKPDGSTLLLPDVRDLARPLLDG